MPSDNNSYELIEKNTTSIKTKISDLKQSPVFFEYAVKMLAKIDEYTQLNSDRDEIKKTRIRDYINGILKEMKELQPIFEQFIEWSSDNTGNITPLVKRLANDLCEYFKNRFYKVLLGKDDPDLLKETFARTDNLKIFIHRKGLLIKLHREMKEAISPAKLSDCDLAKLISEIVNKVGNEEYYPTQMGQSLLFYQLKSIHGDISKHKIDLQTTQHLTELVQLFKCRGDTLKVAVLNFQMGLQLIQSRPESGAKIAKYSLDANKLSIQEVAEVEERLATLGISDALGKPSQKSPRPA